MPICLAGMYRSKCTELGGLAIQEGPYRCLCTGQNQHTLNMEILHIYNYKCTNKCTNTERIYSHSSTHTSFLAVDGLLSWMAQIVGPVDSSLAFQIWLPPRRADKDVSLPLVAHPCITWGENPITTQCSSGHWLMQKWYTRVRPIRTLLGTFIARMYFTGNITG